MHDVVYCRTSHGHPSGRNQDIHVDCAPEALTQGSVVELRLPLLASVRILILMLDLLRLDMWEFWKKVTTLSKPCWMG